MNKHQKEGLAILRIGWPLMGAQLLWLSMVFVDNLLVGQLGPSQLGSLAIASGVFGICNVMMIGVLSVSSALMAASRARRDDVQSRAIAKQSILLSQLIAASIIAAAFFTEEILNALGQDPSLTGDAERYLLALAWGIPFQGLYYAGRQIVEGHQDTAPSLIVAGIAAVLNYFLDLALIHGYGPIPAFGLVGAGYATSIISAFMAIVFLAYTMLRGRYRYLRLHDAEGYGAFATAKEIVSIGVPVTGALLAEMAFFVAATLLIGTLGPLTLAGHQIAINAASFTFMLPLGLSFAISIRVGHHQGHGDPEATRSAAIAGFVICVGLAACISLLFFTAPDLIAGLYTDDANLIATARNLLIAAAFFQLFDCMQVTGMGVLRGLKKGRSALINTCIAFWLIGFPWMWWSTHGVGIDSLLGVGSQALGVWYGLMIGLCVAATMHALVIRAYFARPPVKADAATLSY